MNESSILSGLGARIRRLRSERAWSRRELSLRTGLSERFLAQVETGEGNPSVLRLARIASALGTTPAALLEAAARAGTVALLGLRGAGKSTVGAALSRRLGVSFVELDQRVEESAGLSLREIFEVHGEDAFRRWEREALETVLAQAGPAVLATGGGIVAHPETFDLLRRHTVTFWLKATPTEHWERVVAQGDHRPMANDPLARQNLQELLAKREPLYRTADHTVVTSSSSIEDIVERIIRLL